MSMSNVVRASQILSQDSWNVLFPNADELYTYESFLQAMAKFPKFCGEAKDADDEDSLQNACKVELSTLLAHIKFNSADLTKTVDDCGSNGGNDCDYHDHQNANYPYNQDQQYYGRGALLLTGSKFYGALSSIAFDGALNDKLILLNDPGLVASDGRLAFLSAFKFYMQITGHSTPTMHDTILGFYQPSDYDKQKNICTECFGTTTNILNGKKECRRWIDSANGSTRASYFTEFCEFFGANCPEQTEYELNCSN